MARRVNRRDHTSRYNRAKRAGWNGSADYTTSEILERDHWCCQLCGKKIPRNKRTPHPLSPEIDHILPISQGGLDEAANVQASHRKCNISKGNRTWPTGEQLRLVG
jgi:5-methylcytosine-specific restriction endonuclease McrA